MSEAANGSALTGVNPHGKSTALATQGARCNVRCSAELAAGHGLEKFDSIAEWISDIRAVVPSQWLVSVDRVTGAFAPFDQLFQVDHEQSRMRLFRRPEIILDAKVNLRLAAAEPRTTSASEVRRLRLFLHPQHVSIERAGVLLFARRHRKLNVVNSSNHLQRPTSLHFTGPNRNAMKQGSRRTVKQRFGSGATAS